MVHLRIHDQIGILSFKRAFPELFKLLIQLAAPC